MLARLTNHTGGFLVTTQHIWTIYQAVSDVSEKSIEKCLWRHERFSDETETKTEQVGEFSLANPLTVEEFAELGAAEQYVLIAANVDTLLIESA